MLEPGIQSTNTAEQNLAVMLTIFYVVNEISKFAQDKKIFLQEKNKLNGFGNCQHLFI